MRCHQSVQKTRRSCQDCQQSSGQSLHHSGSESNTWITMVIWFDPQLSFSICWAGCQEMQHSFSGISLTSFWAASWGKNVYSFFFLFEAYIKCHVSAVCPSVCLCVQSTQRKWLSGFLLLRPLTFSDPLYVGFYNVRLEWVGESLQNVCIHECVRVCVSVRLDQCSAKKLYFYIFVSLRRLPL